MSQPSETPESGDSTATPGNESSLAQHLWARYSDSPGVIPIHKTLGLASGRIQSSRDWLPLLSDLQQRWSFSEWPTTPTSVLWYAPLATGPSMPVVPAVVGHEAPWPPPTAATPGHPRPTPRSSRMIPD